MEIEEDGDTFYENALKKAREVSRLSGSPALADDSGLIVEHLGGPGVYSARFAGYPCDHEKNNDLLLRKLKGIENRKARFVCCVVVYYPNGKIVKAKGETLGEITLERRGSGGFGYDPIFYSYDLKKTFGEATPQEKNSVSHRKRALEQLLSLIV